MKRKVDEVGRIVIPSEIRKELNIDDTTDLKIELINGKIILSKPDETDYKEIVYKALNFLSPYIKGEHDDITYEELCVLYKILLKEGNYEVDY